jgi:hypothetical protein
LVSPFFVAGIDSKDIQDIRLVPARTTLHARTRAEMAREARSPAGMISRNGQVGNLFTRSPPLVTSVNPTGLVSAQLAFET